MIAPILIGDEGGWLYFKHIDFDEDTPIKGKYLIFCPNRETLAGIAITEILQHKFEVAKISMQARGVDHVLCLYWTNADRARELASRYKNRTDVKYRWWKSDADTRAGKYSEQFKRACTAPRTSVSYYADEADTDPNEQPADINELPLGEDADFGDSLDLGCKD